MRIRVKVDNYLLEFSLKYGLPYLLCFSLLTSKVNNVCCIQSTLSKTDTFGTGTKCPS